MAGVTNRLGSRQGLLFAGDLVCFVVFAVLGLRSHEDGITAEGIVRAALPFQAGWLLVNALIGKHVSPTQSRQVLRLWVPAWAIAISAASISRTTAAKPANKRPNSAIRIIFSLL